MHKQLLLLIVTLTVTSTVVRGQECNKLGVWLWFIEQTGFSSHEQLANNLAALGVQRIYVKVADGRVDTERWPELIDTDLVGAYKDKGLEVWAWSYNYPLNDSLQAEAIYMAAETGYDGFVVDVETEFDGNPLALYNLFFAFKKAIDRAIRDEIAVDTFNLYCTTWGNPRDHNFSIGVINPFVTGFMPQTYVELWSFADLDEITFWVNEGTKEYRELGATRQIHHITTTQEGLMTSANIDEFIAASGPETSLWRIPGGDVSLGIWQDWREVNWEIDFCASTSTTDSQGPRHIVVYPNPSTGLVSIEGLDNYDNVNVTVYDAMGRLSISAPLVPRGSVDLSVLPSGIYQLRLEDDKGILAHKKVVRQ